MLSRQVHKVARDAEWSFAAPFRQNLELLVNRPARARAGCGRHCATLISQQKNGFSRCETESVGDFDLQLGPFSQAFSNCSVAISTRLFPWRSASRV